MARVTNTPVLKLGILFKAILLFLSAIGTSLGAPPTVPKAAWERSGNGFDLVIPLSSLLTNKQRSMIDGGFTTISDFTVAVYDGEPENIQETILWRVTCSVKFDAWDESYEVAEFKATAERTRAEPVILKNFEDYGSRCLTARAPLSQRLLKASQQGEKIIGHFSVHQTSMEEGQRIKDWLVKQQSGLIQSLFKHMLGELAIHQTLNVKISVPPLPTGPSTILESTPLPSSLQGS